MLQSSRLAQSSALRAVASPLTAFAITDGHERRDWACIIRAGPILRFNAHRLSREYQPPAPAVSAGMRVNPLPDADDNQRDIAPSFSAPSNTGKRMTQTARKTRSSSRLQTPLETYLREINETALLTADEEKDLSRQISAGDGAARDRMVRANLRLVVNIARGYTSKGLPLQDLIEEGNLGLLRAVEGFDPDMNTRFSTYASYWIKQSIKRALVNSAKTIRIPAYMVELLSKWRRASAKLTEELNRTPTAEDIAQELGIPKKKLRIVKKAITLYNATPQVDSDESGMSLGDIIPDDRVRGPEDELVNSDNLIHVFRLLDEMDPREATILRMRFGLDDSEPRTLKEIGEALGLTRERVRQIESEALKRLNRSLSGEF
jgi:RNA polymerase primary sigma factor